MNEAGQEMIGLDAEMREMVLETVRQLRKRMLTQDQILAWDRDEIFPEAEIREMLGPEIGLQLLMIPEAYGGLGGGARDSCAITREMAKICLGVTTGFFAIQLGADPIMVGGTVEQKTKWLGRIASGEALVAYAVTEAEAGSNLAALKTKAEPVTDSDGKVEAYILNGSKQFISNGGYADFCTVLANTPEGPAFFVVEKEMPGFERHKGEEKHGIRASNTSPLTFTDVRVPVANLLGGVPGQGLKQANAVFGYTRVMVGAMALGGGESALEKAITYAQERIQFGTPLSEKQGYTHKLILPNVIRLTAADAYIENISERLDAGGRDLQVEGSIAKLYASESADRAANDAIQALGGYGYINEFEVEKIKRDVKISCIYEGTSEIQQSIISTFRWKATRKSKGGFYNAMAESLQPLGERFALGGAKTMALCVEALNPLINHAHAKRLTRQQHLMFELADTIAQVEVGVALVQKAYDARQASDAEKMRLVSKLFASQTGRMVHRLALTLMANTAGADEAAIRTFMHGLSAHQLMLACQGDVADMDQLANIVFNR